MVLNVWLPAKMVEINATELTEDEAELYDRQIRLWGLDSQKRLVNFINSRTQRRCARPFSTAQLCNDRLSDNLDFIIFALTTDWKLRNSSTSFWRTFIFINSVCGSFSGCEKQKSS